jgi:hypothetical protein
MDKNIARQISDLMSEFIGRLDSSIRLVMENCDQEEFEQYRQKVGRIMGQMHIDIACPIYDEYPELIPDRLRQNNEEVNSGDPT